MTTTLAKPKDEIISDASLEKLDLHTVPMGAQLTAKGATFRTWAPRALEVHIIGEFNKWTISSETALKNIGNGHWACFAPNVQKKSAIPFLH